MKTKIGLYLGGNSVGGVVVVNKKVVSSAKFDLSVLEDEAIVESLTEEIRWEALINKTMRELGTDEKNIYVSLSDKDFIYRTFEMPLMRNKEIKASLKYEIEKYIPFKVEELSWDYSSTTFFKEKKINISFVGIKEANLHKVFDILKRLELNPIIIEPSSLSLMRVLKSLKKVQHLKNFAVFDFTDFEGHLIFFYYNLPVFSRYLVIPKKENALDMGKFLESLRVSFQYFKREFSPFELEEFIVIGNAPHDFTSLLKEELQTEIEVLTPSDCDPHNNSAIETLKALGAAGREWYPYKFKPALKILGEQGLGSMTAGEVSLKLRLVVFLFFMLLLIYFSVFFLLIKKESEFNNQIAALEKNLIPHQHLKNISWNDIDDILLKKKEIIKGLAGMGKNKKSVSPFLEKLPSFLPEGMWLDNITFSRESNKYKLIIRGYVFLKEQGNEQFLVDQFIANLKGYEELKSLFSTVKLNPLNKEKMNKIFDVTVFVIEIE